MEDFILNNLDLLDDKDIYVILAILRGDVILPDSE